MPLMGTRGAASAKAFGFMGGVAPPGNITSLTLRSLTPTLVQTRAGVPTPPPTGYKSVANPGSITATGASRYLQISGLSASTAYTVSGYATNAGGQSATPVNASFTSAAATWTTTGLGSFGLSTNNTTSQFPLKAAYSSVLGYIIGGSNSGVNVNGLNGNITSITPSTGAISYQQQYEATVGATQITGVAVNTAGDMYISLNSSADGTNPNGAFPVVMKYNSSYVLQWQNRFPWAATPSRSFATAYAGASDNYNNGNNNFIVGGRLSDGTTKGAAVMAIQANGISAGFVSYQVTSASYQVLPFSTSSNNNYIVVGGQVDYGGGQGSVYRGYIAMWTNNLVGWGNASVSMGIGSSPGSVNSVAFVPGSTSTTFYAGGYTTDGNFQNKAVLLQMAGVGITTNATMYDGLDNYQVGTVKCSTDGFVYVTVYGGPITKWYLLKFNASTPGALVLQWQRVIDITTSANAFKSIKDIIIEGTSYICLVMEAPEDPYFVGYTRLPVDGTKTGTYTVGTNTFSYQTSALTVVAGEPAIDVNGLLTYNNIGANNETSTFIPSSVSSNVQATTI